MGVLQRVVSEKPVELTGVTWWRVWRLTRPTTVYVEGEDINANAGDALWAGPGQRFTRVRVEGEALVEYSTDTHEPFPGNVPNANGAVLLYERSILEDETPGEGDPNLPVSSGLIDVRGFSSVLMDVRFLTNGAGCSLDLLTQDDDPTNGYIVTEVADGDVFASGVSYAHQLIAWPCSTATPDPYNDGDGEGFKIIPISAPLPGWVGVRANVAAGHMVRVRMWGRR